MQEGLQSICREYTMKVLLASVIVLFVSGCGPQFSDQTMAIFPKLEQLTAQNDQNFRVVWHKKIVDNLKDGDQRKDIETYLQLHESTLVGVAETAKQLNAAIKAQAK